MIRLDWAPTLATTGDHPSDRRTDTRLKGRLTKNHSNGCPTTNHRSDHPTTNLRSDHHSNGCPRTSHLSGLHRSDHPRTNRLIGRLRTNHPAGHHLNGCPRLIRLIGHHRNDCRRAGRWGACFVSGRQAWPPMLRRSGSRTGAENDEERHPCGWRSSSVQIRRRPTLPGDLSPSTIGAERLNFRVRDGNGCDPLAMATGNLLSIG